MRFKEATCHNCGKKGHIKAACRSKKQPQRGRRQFQRRGGTTKWVDTNGSGEDTGETDVEVYSVRNHSNHPDPRGSPGRWTRVDYGGRYRCSSVDHLRAAIEEGPAKGRDQSNKCKIEDVHIRKNPPVGSDTSYNKVRRAEQEIDPLCDIGRWTVSNGSRVATMYSTQLEDD